MTKYAATGAILERIAQTIANVKTISGPNLSVDVDDVTTHDSTAAWEEVVVTILRSGEVTLELVYDPEDATVKYAAGGIIHDLVARTAVAYSLIFPVSVVEFNFNAFVVGFTPTAPVGAALTATAVFKLTGEVTLN
jgi:hypothetical protein